MRGTNGYKQDFRHYSATPEARPVRGSPENPGLQLFDPLQTPPNLRSPRRAHAAATITHLRATITHRYHHTHRMLLRSYLPLLLPIAASASTFTVSDRGSAFASLHVKLEAGETMQSEPGALVRYSGDLRLGIRSSSGWLGRIFAGEAPWTTSISATSSAGECMLCPQGIGDIKILELASDEAICLAAGCFLAADSTVAVTSEFHSSLSRTLFSGTGMRYLVCAGPGVCAFNGHGSMVKRS